MKNQYRIRNWSEYNAGLKHRGSITFWLSADVIEEWLIIEKTGKRGASNTYNDIAIATMSTIKGIFNLAGRQAQGQPRMGQIVVLRRLGADAPRGIDI